jgi:hypothetical protein
MSRVVPKHMVRRVQSRAGLMCEYCKLPDWLAFADFEIDYIIARVHEGTSGLDNLAWSCITCNTFNLNEGPNLASVDATTGKVTKLFHPLLNRWSSHFRLSEGLLIPKTAAGRATLSLLRMNLPQSFSLRRAVEQSDATYAGRVLLRCA